MNNTLEESLETLKNTYTHNTQDIYIGEVIGNIFENINDKMDNKKLYMDQILGLIENNEKYTNEFFNLIKMLDNNHTRDNIIDKFDEIIENKNLTINIIKQIKYNYLKDNEGKIHSSTGDKIDENVKELDEIKRVDNNKQNHMSLYELQLNDNKINISTSLEDKIRLVNINPYEIMKREEESRNLQMDLLCDLEDFHNNKVNSEKESVPYVLEDLLKLD